MAPGRLTELLINKNISHVVSHVSSSVLITHCSHRSVIIEELKGYETEI